jgi:hypothetical protein
MGYARTVMAAAAAALLMAVGVRFLGPAAAAFVEEELPRARAVAATWLTPPYLYLVINAIIISIAASSRFQSSGGRPSAPSYAPAADADADAIGGEGAGEEMEQQQDGIQQAVASLQVPAAVPVVAAKAAEVAAAVVEEPVVVEIHTVAVAPEGEVDEDYSVSRSTWTPRRRGAEPEVAEAEVPPFADLTNSRKKPLVSARFSRKATKPSPEGNNATYLLFRVPILIRPSAPQRGLEISKKIWQFCFPQELYAVLSNLTKI